MCETRRDGWQDVLQSMQRSVQVFGDLQTHLSRLYIALTGSHTADWQVSWTHTIIFELLISFLCVWSSTLELAACPLFLRSLSLNCV